MRPSRQGRASFGWRTAALALPLLAPACTSSTPPPAVQTFPPPTELQQPSPGARTPPIAASPSPEAELDRLATGSLEVSCQPADRCAITRIDDREIPPTGLVELPAGQRRLTISAPGFEPAARTVQVTAGERRLLEVSLRPLPASVTFTSRPSEARIRVDGRLLDATTPTRDLPLEPGTREVELIPDDLRYRPVTLEQRWEAEGRYRVDVSFELRAARVRFASDRPWDQLELDGKSLGPTDAGWLEVTAGRHRAVATAGRHAAIVELELAPGDRRTERLDWCLVSPDPDRFVLLPEVATVTLGSSSYPDLNPTRSVAMKAYWIGRTEVTVGEYRACFEAGRCAAPAVAGEHCNWGTVGREEHPINCVSAVEAETYAHWLSSLDALDYRLPTPEEWERAARGTRGSRFPWGDTFDAQRCNGCDRECPWRWRDKQAFDGWATTAPVAALERCHGPDQVYDLVGNVAEWCRTADGERYSVHGGSWRQMEAFLDPALVTNRPRHERQATVGFRLVVSGFDGFSKSR